MAGALPVVAAVAVDLSRSTIEALPSADAAGAGAGGAAPAAIGLTLLVFVVSSSGVLE